jgi:hypothetical protein
MIVMLKAPPRLVTLNELGFGAAFLEISASCQKLAIFLSYSSSSHLHSCSFIWGTRSFWNSSGESVSPAIGYVVTAQKPLFNSDTAAAAEVEEQCADSYWSPNSKPWVPNCSFLL